MGMVFSLLFHLLLAPASAMTPSSVSVPPRSPVAVFSAASGDGLGLSVLTRQSRRSSETQNTTTWRSNLLADYRFRDGTTAILSFPHVYHHASGSGVNQTTNGPGDLALYGKHAFYQDRPLHPTREASFLLGIKFPTGTTSARDHGVRLPAPQQPGTGTLDFVLGGTVWARTRSLNLYSDMTYKVNTHAAYTFGNFLSANAGLSRPLPGAELLVLTGEVNAEAAGRDRSLESGAVDATGGETVFLTPGLQWQAALDLTLSFSVQLPAYQRLNGKQLRSGPNFNLGVHTRF